MADIKISAAADAGTLVATDKVPLARSASTTAYSATMAEIATWANTQLPVASTSISGTVKVDGTTITISGGTISGTAAPLPSSSLPFMDGTAAPGTATAWSRGDHVHPSDTAKAPLASPTFTGTPAAPTPTTGDNTTRIATTAFVQSQMVASGAGVSTWNTRAGAVVLQQSDITAVGALNDTGRNLLHNGVFSVWQRGSGPWTATGANTYTADRWKYFANLDTVSFAQTSLSDANRAAIGDETANFALYNSFTGNAGAAASTYAMQNIEGLRRLAGKTVTLSFWSAASAALKLGASIAQLFGTGGSPSADLYPNGQSVTLATTPARYSLTFNIPSISGKTLGTNGNDSTLLMLWYTSGATNNALSGNVGVQSGAIWLWGVQLEFGSVATPLARREYAEELRLCQRYYWVCSPGAINFSGNSPAGGFIGYARVSFPVTMRATPTVAYGAPSLVNVSTTGVANAGPSGADLSITSTAAGSFLATFNVPITASADL